MKNHSNLTKIAKLVKIIKIVYKIINIKIIIDLSNRLHICKAYRSTSHVKNHSYLTKFTKIVKKNHKNHKKIVNVKNHYKPLEIQPIPFYLIIIFISWTYHPF